MASRKWWTEDRGKQKKFLHCWKDISENFFSPVMWETALCVCLQGAHTRHKREHFLQLFAWKRSPKKNSRFFLFGHFLCDLAWKQNRKKKRQRKAPIKKQYFVCVPKAARGAIFVAICPTTNGWHAKWKKLSRNMYTLRTRFCTFGCRLACSVGWLVNKISTSELRRKSIKSALLVGCLPWVSKIISFFPPTLPCVCVLLLPTCCVKNANFSNWIWNGEKEKKDDSCPEREIHTWPSMKEKKSFLFIALNAKKILFLFKQREESLLQPFKIFFFFFHSRVCTLFLKLYLFFWEITGVQVEDASLSLFSRAINGLWKEGFFFQSRRCNISEKLELPYIHPSFNPNKRGGGGGGGVEN